MEYAIEFVKGMAIWALGGLIPPKRSTRTPERQAEVDRQCLALVLYDLSYSPFCAKVRRRIDALNLKVKLAPVVKDKALARELVRGGGMYQIPCLRIDEEGSKPRWLYESEDIKKYLSDRFG